METQPKKWYNRWWAILLAMLLGALVGYLLKSCGWMNCQSGLNL